MPFWKREKKGLDQGKNSVGMMVLVMGPLYAFWFGLQLFIPKPDQPLYAGVGMVMWAAYVGAYYAWAKTDAASYESFPQSTWWFDKTHWKHFDLLVKHDGWEIIQRFKDGRIAALVHFADTYAYEDPLLAETRTFDEAYLILPTEKGHTFTFVSGGEIFHKNISISHRAGSPLSVHVVDWEEEQGIYRPIGLVADSGWHFERTMKNAKALTTSSKYDALKTVYNYMANRHIQVKEHNVKLVGELDALYKLSEKTDKLLHLRLQDLKRWYGHILRVKTGWRTKIFGVQTLAAVLFFMFLTYIVGRYVFNWW